MAVIESRPLRKGNTMKTLLTLIASFGLYGIAGFAQPTVLQISNAASQSLSVPAADAAVYGWNTLPNGSIALGSFFTIYGNGFGGNASACGANLQNCAWKPYPLPTQIQNTSVSVTVGTNTPVAPYIELAVQLNGYSQINAILPSNTPLGAGTLTVTYNQVPSAAVPINVVASSFGTFTQNEGGDGPGVITDANYVVGTPFHTFMPGQAVILWGTGLGPAPDPATEVSAAPCLAGCDLRGKALSVTVWVGNQEVEQSNLIYAGRAPGFTGEDELVFYIPTNVTTGCYVSVAVQSGPPGGTQVTSNVTTVAVDANAAPCRDANGVNMNDIASLVQTKGSANVAAIGLLSDFWNVNYQGSFDQWDNDIVDGQIGTFGSPGALNLFRGFTRAPSVNSCTAVPYLGWPPATDYGLAYVKYLDAGAALTIQGSLATAKVPKNSNGTYDGVVGGAATYQDSDGGLGIAPFYWNSTPNGDGTFNVTSIASGTYTVTGPGGADVGGFTGAIDISSAAAGFVWTNVGAFDDQNGIPAFPRSTPLSITWSGGDPQGFVDIVLIGSTLQNTEPSTTNPEPALYVECVAPASAGSYNVPSYLLQALPAPGPGFPLAGMVFVGPASAVTKVSQAPTGLDAAYLYYKIISGYSVQWQ
jgi:uncharacterized protein (TIGR03437 family)